MDPREEQSETATTEAIHVCNERFFNYQDNIDEDHLAVTGRCPDTCAQCPPDQDDN